MDSRIKVDNFQDALDNCAAEPVHIPGIIQPFACLIGVDAQTNRIEYASDNCAAFLGHDTTDLLGCDLNLLFDAEFMHALNNAIARPGFLERTTLVGHFPLGGAETEVRAFGSNGTTVIQFEPVRDPGLGNGDALGTLTFLMQEIQSCTNQKHLFELTTKVLRHLSGYDRVMIYKFDSQFNGEVLAEACQRGMEPFVGLRFPQWDIPVQARAIMQKLPLRFIVDVDQETVPLQAAGTAHPPLDITFAECRGVSSVHMEYLRNMGTQSTMTISVVVEGALWGIISFHHRRPHVPSQKLREVLIAFQELFATKLASLRKEAQLVLVRKTDKVKDSTLDEIDGEEALEGALARIGEVVEDVLQAQGLFVYSGSRMLCHGKVPDTALLEHLGEEMRANLGEPIVSDNLGVRYPAFKDSLNGCAGVFASATAPDRALCIFRQEEQTTVSWAGSPDKTISLEAGKARLAPRASFSAYLEDIKGCSAAWTEDDLYFAERIWILINSAERRALKNALNRQQAIMINELNHRVRNILALVRSVSRQAQRHNGSLDSYAASLESRIQALAAAHDIASGSSATSADIRQLIDTETEPYQSDARIRIEGPTRYLRADIAPIFSLVIHELATNAVKYGALSTDQGKIHVSLKDVAGGFSINWRESGGPEVTPPNAHGFGSSLIEQAVPHEMGGKTELRFLRDGLEADLFLPMDVFDVAPDETSRSNAKTRFAIVTKSAAPFDPQAFDGFVLLLEDNFVISSDMKDQLEKSGIEDVEICSTTESALELLDADRPGFAFLDVNLGPGKTSEPVARRLMEEGIPFVFVTGYGSKAELAAEFNRVPRLAKPVATSELKNAMMALRAKTPA